MLMIAKGDRARIFAMIEDVAVDDGPAKSEVTLADGTTIKVYKVVDVIRVDFKPIKS